MLWDCKAQSKKTLLNPKRKRAVWARTTGEAVLYHEDFMDFWSVFSYFTGT